MISLPQQQQKFDRVTIIMQKLNLNKLDQVKQDLN